MQRESSGRRRNDEFIARSKLTFLIFFVITVYVVHEEWKYGIFITFSIVGMCLAPCLGLGPDFSCEIGFPVEV